MLLVLKLVLVPALVAGATLGARRWGPRIGGWLTALPLVAGPTLFFLAMEQGHVFAARAALATLVGLVSVAAFGVVYGRVALRHRWPLTLLAGWAAFGVATALAHPVRWTPLTALAVALLAFALALRLLPPEHPHPPPAASPAWDLPLRMLGTLAVVLTVTHVAERLGPALSGALTPFPIALSVVLAFAQAQQGPALAIGLLRGFFPAMWGFALFCLVVALAMAPLGPGAAFALALATQALAHGVLLWRMVARRSDRRTS
ncbi:MAG TPA: hypothetical protein VFL90_19870 [Methylomirabilota bacterium]|nr:hypothetical protein [Methylomirabilota bacterium]